MQNKIAELKPDGHYHVFNRSIDGVPLFVSDANFNLFLDRYRKYVMPLVDTFCYCLMTNHFHLLIRVKDEATIRRVYFERKLGKIPENGEDDSNPSPTELTNFIARQFGHWFNGYAQAFNKQQGRRGNLFERPFKRKQVRDEQHLKRSVQYIHCNPVEAGLVRQVDDYRYSSYSTLVSTGHTFLVRDEVIEWFGDLTNFKACHSKSVNML